MEILTKETFKEKVFNFQENKEWSFKGAKPAIIDFYAQWCGPCKMVAPILEQVSQSYAGKLDVYKVDTEQEQELAAMFQIRSVPSILFIPLDGQPTMAAGALSKQQFEEVIADVFKLSA